MTANRIPTRLLVDRLTRDWRTLQGLTRTAFLTLGLGLGLSAATVGFASSAWAQDPEEAAEEEALDEAAVITEVSAYLNSISTMSGEFLQIDPDGVIREGQFYLRRPGRLRFQYERPHAYRVIADGTWVAVVEDDNDNNIERTLLIETPLYILLKDDVDLADEEVIQAVDLAEDQLRLTAIDPDEDDSGVIVMVFDADPLQLRQWIITTPENTTTIVALRSTESNIDLDPELFLIPDANDLGDDRR